MISYSFVGSVRRASAYQKWQEQIFEMRKVAYKDPLSRSRMSTVGIQQVEASLEVIFSFSILQSDSLHMQYHPESSLLGFLLEQTTHNQMVLLVNRIRL